MKTYVFVICLLGACSAAPKVENSSWDNLLQIGGDIEVTKTSSGRSNDVSIQEYIENYFKSNEISFKLPIVASTVSMAARNLDHDELGFKLNFSNDEQARGKKSKLKKIFAPILVFILIKAMTLIPLALGLLSLKTWNAIQLSFISFVTTLAMAVWKLCSKVNGDHQSPPPHIIHEAYDPHHHHHHIAAARSDQEEANNMAYNGYASQQQH